MSDLCGIFTLKKKQSRNITKEFTHKIEKRIHNIWKNYDFAKNEFKQYFYLTIFVSIIFTHFISDIELNNLYKTGIFFKMNGDTKR